MRTRARAVVIRGAVGGCSIQKDLHTAGGEGLVVMGGNNPVMLPDGTVVTDHDRGHLRPGVAARARSAARRAHGDVYDSVAPVAA